MADQQSGQQNQDAEIQAHNAVKHALSELNQAQDNNTDRRHDIQAAQEQLDQAHLQLAQARNADSDNPSTSS
ncbi:hypothetical protein P9314_12890 [Paenibacillus validus]|uniref:Uncharacterized protein n=1 Tax=Paenibacillus validus TaxID=44253 RepID=A0A7X3CSC4_9BACL|nr:MULTISPECIES: hypothetical protein [Paenibacillus]MED4601599.1 hypothetical protein [Paenibacillus validus]MED4607615.1 hypothetical protein [Paenibacillus validus]MUG71620.1 hypothetical protein [Paenibacillus validus]